MTERHLDLIQKDRLTVRRLIQEKMGDLVMPEKLVWYSNAALYRPSPDGTQATVVLQGRQKTVKRGMLISFGVLVLHLSPGDY